MKKFIAIALLIIALMFGEYHYIMHNIQPYYADGYVYIDFMGQTNTYYFEKEE